MMPAIEDMPAIEAMPRPRAVAGESRRRISYANGIPSENAGQLLVIHGNRIYNMDCSFTPSKAKDPLSACNAAGPSNTPRRTSPMVRLRYTTDSITHLANPNPSDTQFERTVCVPGGAS
jgi:hypothetical protein